MGDAEIIPIGTRGRPGRGAGKQPSSAARGLAPTKKAPAKKAPAKKPAAGTGQGGPGQGGPGQGGTGSGGTGADATAEPTGSQQSTTDEPSSAEEQQTPPAAREGAPTRDAQASSDEQGTRAGEAEESSPLSASSAATDAPLASPLSTRERNPLRSIPTSAWLSAFQEAAMEVFGDSWEPRLAEFLAFLRRRITGDYVVDEYGFDAEVTQRFFMAALRPIAQQWFRIEVRGAENIPADGGALVVSNHSGTVPVDGLMTMVSIHDHTGRHLRALGADLVFQLPVISSLARKGGATLACNEDAERMLRGGELVGVWPEGFKGIGKPFSQRYKLQRFGRGGFVSAALRTGVPIVPLAVVGAEEIYPLVGNIPALARLIGVPYIPVTPLFPLLGPLGLIPLPSKWLLEFGEPIRTDEYDDGAADDPMLVFDVTDQVRETIQQTLYSLLMQRSSVFG
ncbi:lysophospholipid acyltransferase family protein [Nocardioides sp.]|uniref:lysophospholipid acyltransferase family protein n=1 Tax=Nocardioides sp. TaxID=35761 RepID=UPI002610F30A|nr:lysophospholipid acyltransferase family protein [Nocardioides sp.]